MTNDELIAHFQLCETWQDADQWDALGMEYFRRGYVLNAGVCFRRADGLRPPPSLPLNGGGECAVVVETGVEFQLEIADDHSGVCSLGYDIRKG